MATRLYNQYGEEPHSAGDEGFGLNAISDFLIWTGNFN
jgi:hypothetical protein